MKKGVFIGIVLLIGFLIWYLFVKPYDYLITFKIKAIPGTINQSIKLWNSTLNDAHIIDSENLNTITQRVKFNDSLLIYNWRITSLNDSISKVKVYIKDETHSLKNKVEVLFINSNFKKRSKSSVKDFVSGLQDHIKNFKVTIDGKEGLDDTYCIYVLVKSSQFDKAKGMMIYYPLLTDFIVKNNIEPNGRPFVEVIDWNMKKDSIEYNFCFPIKNKDSLPIHKYLRYKQIDGFKALKATYNGNYITSDRAWYTLQDYAKNNNIEITNKPVEVFHNNPNMGGDALQWEAEVYMPIK